MNIQETLMAKQDLKYRDFTIKLVPGIDVGRVIGVRAPEIRKLAKLLMKDDAERRRFMSDLPHRYHEENILHGYLLEMSKGTLADVMTDVENFLPYVDNWMVCDTMTPKLFKQYPDEVRRKSVEWMRDEAVYTIRFALVVHLLYMLDDHFDERIFAEINAITNDDYYVKMAVAWYYSFALIKQWSSTLPIIEGGQLEKWTHNMTIRKACESYRMTLEKKNYLKKLRKR